MSEPNAGAIQRQDPKLHAALHGEYERQRTQLELIASENYVSDAVLEAAGSVLTNKYAEGLPGKRYYGGCEWVDVAEDLARERVKQLFGADHANVQPHSGASANLAAYLAVSDAGDTLLGMSLAHGGHLTHGHPVSVSGRLWKPVQYGVRLDDGLTLLATADPARGRVSLAVYPWDITLGTEPPHDSALNVIHAPIRSIAELGNRVRLAVGPVSAEITAESLARLGLRSGQPVYASFKATGTRVVAEHEPTP